jgi:perosamine synthetase
MIPRRKLDIDWTDLFTGIIFCLHCNNRNKLESDIEALWSSERQALTSLSVRSGFDALLQALALPEGSEVLMSAITIPDMIAIVRKHGLVPIPVDLDVETLSIAISDLVSAVTIRTKLIVVAHVFGTRMPLDDILSFAKKHQLMLIEDCAQAYIGLNYKGEARADVSMFSFGSIKTCSALGGAILSIRNPKLLYKIKSIQSRYAIQQPFFFLCRLGKYILIKLLSYRFVFSLFVILCRITGANHDEIINRNSRNFKETCLFEQIRQQVSTPQLALMKHRFRHWDPGTIQTRIEKAKRLVQQCVQIRYPGSAAASHSYWLFPLLCSKPAALVSTLWKHGFDATQGGKRLIALTNTNDPSMRGSCANAREIIDTAVYLPLYNELNMNDLNRLALVLNRHQQHDQ